MPPPIIEVPAFQNILQYTTSYILDNFSNHAPDYSNLYVLLPHSQVTQQFNETLCRSLTPELPAIIPPWTGTLKAWSQQFVANKHPENQIIGEYSRQLLFIEAIQQHPDLFKEENKWQVTQALFSLFDELSLNQKNIFTSPEKWQQQLQRAYGIEQQHQHLLNESNLVYTLWHAWQQQLSENQLYDETTDYISRLTNASATINSQDQFICLELSQYTKTEQDFIQNLVNNNQCQVINFKKTISTDNNHSEHNHAFLSFISETFKPLPVERPSSEHLSLKQRARSYAKQHSKSFSTSAPFSVYLAADEEDQIRAIDYYVRVNLL